MIGSNLVHGLNAHRHRRRDRRRRPDRRPEVPQPARREASATTSTRPTSTPASRAASSARSTPCCTRAPAPTRWSTTGATCSTPTTAARRTCSTPARRRARGCSTPRRPRPTAAAPRSARSRSSSSRSTSTATRKLLFDNVVRRMLPTAHDAGRGLSLLQRLRPARAAQGRAWPRWPSTTSTSSASTARSSCSASTAATAPGQQSRDFVFVDDVVAVNLWFLQHPEAERHLQPRQRPRAALQRRGAWPPSTPARALKGEPALPLAELVRAGPGRVHPLPRGAGRQVPVLHRRPT